MPSIQVIADPAGWSDWSPADLVRGAVAEMARITLRHQPFLRAVVLVSAAHPEVRRRGSRYSQELGDLFGRLLLRVAGAITHNEPEQAIRSCFEVAFSASIIRVA